MRLLRPLSLALLLGIANVSLGQGFTPSPQQIEMFKSLSPAQQRQMAAEAGIDLESLGISVGGGGQPDLREEASITDEERNRELAREQEQQEQAAQEAAKAPAESKKKAAVQTDKTLTLFGRHLFKTGLDSLRPAIDIPIPANYVVGPGDTIVVQLYGKENNNYPLVINREGQVQFPQIGPITLAGLTFNQTQEVIADIVNEQMIGVRSSVTMGALRSIRVFVMGEVERPGSFSVGSLANMTNALFASGGISEVGSLRNVQLRRGGELVTTLDLYDLLLRGDTSNDSRLLPGDVIFVPPIGKTVGIRGEVNRPALYEVHDDTDAGAVMKLAGGLKNSAHLPISYLVRLDDFGERTLINIDLSSEAGKQYPIQDGDVLSIASTLDVINNQVTLSGHVKRTGPRSWHSDLRFTDLVTNARDLLPNPDIDMALIQRFSQATRQVEAVLFSPRAAWEAPGTEADPLLQGDDVIQLFNYEDNRPQQLAELIQQLQTQASFLERQQVVNISGSVRFPGLYPLSKGMTTNELIRLAGGLTESAMGTNGEITRYDIDKNRQRVVQHFNVDLTHKPMVLDPGDTLRIKQIPLWKKKESVELAGEVIFPGTYTILPGETLVDVLARAGGLTSHAYPLGTIFSRAELRKLEEQRISELKEHLQSDIAASAVAETTGRDAVGADQAQLLLRNLDAVRPLGRMVINLPTILSNPANHDFQLEDGDSIFIPRYKPSVTVVGEVQYPTSHFFDKSLDAISYVDRSGGFKRQADEKRMYIVKADGSVSQPRTSAWFRAQTDSIQPGDTIVVPLQTDQVDKLELWSRTTQIIYQAALGAAAIRGF